MWFGNSKAKRFRRRKYSDYFWCLDINGNGSIDWDDFHHHLLRLTEHFGWAEDGPEFQRLLSAGRGLWLAMVSRMDEDGDGVVSHDEFTGFYDSLASDLGGADASLPSWASEQIDALFGSLDHNGDGAISQDEYALYLRAIGSDADAADVFSTLDTNQDGQIDMTEIKAHFIEWVTSCDPEQPGNLLMTGRLRL